ncbi:phosphoglycerate kinase [Methylovirgula sp. 4M-Z18]|uniref:phosphoglycerate kinase n=1 Tax=Methylovirgula sp. 4M-Z18 TaxID=2293567 RepID=UPI000E2F8F6E|nr:phosphoglycerate kinase [Methylovirgula sp. 4M-Z18]RFB78369.1 phosphoglycerate kinase [Methylovirgula sp. 4M-Z18]
MASFRTLDDVNLSGKRVLVRVDLNVPMENGKVSDATRIERVLPTIREIANKNGKVILLAHFGRPKGGPDDANSLRPVAAALSQMLHRPVAFAEDCIGEKAAAVVDAMKNEDVALLENTRFHKGEEKNDPAFVAELAKLGDVYVNDAFSAAHRAHASTEGLAHVLPAYVGRTMQAELEALAKALEQPARPVMAVVGGAKVSSKLELLGNLVKKVDILVIGGGMANTFLAAQGKAVGKSLCEKDLLDTARSIIETAKGAGCEIVLPLDAVVAKEFKAHAPSHVTDVDHVGADDMILDIGPRSVVQAEAKLGEAKTLVWNGPFGAFEMQPFDAGTNAVAAVAARLTAEGKLLSVAGGGDTVAALNQAGAADRFTYISTAGGAFLEWLEGKDLPGVTALHV